MKSNHIISAIDGLQYCKANGKFARHIATHGLSYKTYYDTYIGDPKKCPYCGIADCAFDKTTMLYKTMCNSNICRSVHVKRVKANFDADKWVAQKQQFQRTMATKTVDELSSIQDRRIDTARRNTDETGLDAYQRSVIKRRLTNTTKHGDPTYNNAAQISETKLNWDAATRTAFVNKLKQFHGGKWPRPMLLDRVKLKARLAHESRGRYTPLAIRSKWLVYSSSVRQLTEQNYQLYKHTINPNGYQRTLCGVDGGYQLDHIISIKQGFDKKLLPEQLADISNLQMLPWLENSKKGSTYVTT